MDPQAELQQLDESLSEMTSLLLSDGGEDGDDLDGDFAPIGEPAAAAPTAPQAVEPAEDADESGELHRGGDAVEQLEEVQATVAAALEEAAADLTDHGEAVSEDDSESAHTAEGAGDEAVEPEILIPQEPETNSPEPEIVSPSPVMPETPTPQAEEPAAPVAAAPSPETAVPSTPVQAESEPEAESESESEARPETQTDPAPDPEPTKAPREPKQDSGTLKARALDRLGPVGRVLTGTVGTALALGVEPMAVVMTSQSKVLRQSLAWVAVWTAFNAGAVWSYLIFFRSAGPDANPPAVTQIVGAELSPAAAAAGMTGNPGSLKPAAAILAAPGSE